MTFAAWRPGAFRGMPSTSIINIIIDIRIIIIWIICPGDWGGADLTTENSSSSYSSRTRGSCQYDGGGVGGGGGDGDGVSSKNPQISRLHTEMVAQPVQRILLPHHKWKMCVALLI